ncbi:hypothetical protein AB0G54_03135 [Streptomyces yokosukanensis]|uniref:hypothetical protein n=1 Tax=Streptomyces yokosukanensis TaxID=67386 RepID=UPI003427779E
MAVEQLPDGVREFASCLDALLARLDRDRGWSGVFWRRDPDGMRACRQGREVPPWDVVEALLEDLAEVYGSAVAAAERERAHVLYRAALVAYDARPGARDALADRLDAMLREQRWAAERHAELTRLLSSPACAEDADSLRLDLAWAQDDHARATARCAELRDRLAQSDISSAIAPQGAAPLSSGMVAEASSPSSSATVPQVAPSSSPAPAGPRRRRRGSARFAGMAEDAGGAVVPQASSPAAGEVTPRGARFAGGGQAVEPAAAPVEAVDVEAGAAVAGVVERLARLRGEGRGGEAHVLLAEVAQWPPGRLPPLADALRRAGLGADWATLLWEAASLPAERLVAVARALAAAGRDADGRQLLRQGVSRPPEQIGAAVLRLAEAGHRQEAEALADACVRVRTAAEAARSVVPDPRLLVPLLLRAARAVSDERHWDLVHALRVAGHAT